MERILQRQSDGLSVGYSDKDYSNNLRGENFKFVQRGGAPCLSIDLSGNIHVRNKRTNCYTDALEFVEKHAMLNFLQVDEAKLVEKFASMTKEAPTAWKIELDCAEKGAFLYSVRGLKVSNGSAFFDLQFQ